MIEGISHITIIVTDLDKSSRFFTSIFDAVEIYSSGSRTFSLSREKYFLVGDLWICIMEGEPLSERTYNHVAFQVPDSEFDDYAARVRELGLEIRPGRLRVEEEGRSIYFYDHDNHLFEIHTGSLKERLERYKRGSAGD